MIRLCVVFVLCASCGRDECADYAKTFCDKIALCDASSWTASCEQQTTDGMHAAHMTQERCQAANEAIAPMGCTSFNALLNRAVNSR